MRRAFSDKWLTPVVTLLVSAVLLLIFSPAAIPNLRLHEAERDSFETSTHDAQNQSIILRLNSPQPGKILIDRTLFSIYVFFTFSVAMLVFPRAPFRPFFYLLKKRILLRPIKYTSMFVG